MGYEERKGSKSVACAIASTYSGIAHRRSSSDGSDPATYVRAHQLSLAPTYRMVATLAAPLARVAQALEDIAELEPIDPMRTRITIDGDTLEWLAFRLMLLDCDFEIHEPPELDEYLGRLAARLGRNRLPGGTG